MKPGDSLSLVKGLVVSLFYPQLAGLGLGSTRSTTIRRYIRLATRYESYTKSTVCEYFRRSAEVVILRMRAVFRHSLASHRRKYEKSRQCLRVVLCV